MSVLIATLSSGKGTWAQVSQIISTNQFDKIYLICNEFAYKTFEVNQNKVLKLLIDENKPYEAYPKLSKFFKSELKGEFDVAINVVSGSGAEHMSVLSAVLKAGVGIRFIYLENKEIKEFELLDEKYVPQEGEDLVF